MWRGSERFGGLAVWRFSGLAGLVGLVGLAGLAG